MRESSRRDRIARVSQPYYSESHGHGHSDSQRRVYVGNLSWDVSWQDLKDHMKAAGRVLRADVMQDSATGRSKGCGIVEFSSAREADEAIRTLHDSELRGRKIFVREDRVNHDGGAPPMHVHAPPPHAEYAPRVVYHQPPPMYHAPPPAYALPPRRGMDGPAAPMRGTGPTGVVVKNLPPGLDWKVLKDHFRSAGFVLRADIVTDGVGVVDFQSVQDARQAVDQLDRTTIGEHVISVRLRGTTTTNSEQHDDADVDRERERARGRERDREDVEEADEGRRHVARHVYRDNDNDEDRKREPPAPFQGERKLYVGQLAWSVNWQRLKDHFKQAGVVLRADVVTEPNSTRSRGFGFVEFATAEEAKRALEELDGSLLDGRRIYVKEDVRDR